MTKILIKESIINITNEDGNKKQPVDWLFLIKFPGSDFPGHPLKNYAFFHPEEYSQ